ncbi:AAA family ATPase [Candidatus Jidaibacter acanthamoebae]
MKFYNFFLQFYSLQHNQNSLDIRMSKALDITMVPEPIKDPLNALLKKYNLEFELAECRLEKNQFTILFKKQSELISFSQLSSGEKVMFTLISCAFSNQLVSKYLSFDLSSILLFDEIDIHFHPEYIESFFKIIRDHFSSNTHIVITTHNPATIALAEQLNKKDNGKEFGFYNLLQENGLTKIEKVASARTAISYLSEGLINVIEDFNYVLVESTDDAKFFAYLNEKLKPHYASYPKTQLIFLPVGFHIKQDRKIQTLCDKIHKYGRDNALQEGLSDLLEDVVSTLEPYTKTNEQGGGCKQVYSMVESLAGTAVGTVDWDRHNLPKEKVYVLNFYSIENYLCSPFNLLYVLNNKKEVLCYDLVIKEIRTHENLSNFDIETVNWNTISQKDLQNISNSVFKVLMNNNVSDKEKRGYEKKITVELINGMTIEVPEILRTKRGHDLQQMISMDATKPEIIKQNPHRTRASNNVSNNDLLEAFNNNLPIHLAPKFLLTLLQDIKSSKKQTTISEQLLEQEEKLENHKRLDQKKPKEGENDQLIKSQFLEQYLNKSRYLISDINEKELEKFCKTHLNISNTKQNPFIYAAEQPNSYYVTIGSNRTAADKLKSWQYEEKKRRGGDKDSSLRK